MQTTGNIIALSKDWATNKLLINLQVDDCPVEEVQALSQCEKLSIEIKKYRKKRSLDANGMLWACIGEIANVLRADKWEIYLQMLKRYGKYTYICVKPAVVEAVKAQWRECEEIGKIDINGKEAVQMLCYFGSSTYDTKEFSVLLDGVISEMREIGLQPPPTEEMKRALETWQK